MKKITILLLLVFSMNSFAQESITWDYPVRPGTKEWEKLSSYDERLNAYNIPGSIVERISTENLVQICLDYPEFRLIMTRNSLQLGYDYLKTIFNGFVELEKRKDAGIELLKEYKKLHPATIKNFDTPVKRGKYAFKFTYIEILLAQKPIIENMDSNIKKELIKRSISNYESIQTMPENYSTFDLLTPGLVLGRLLDVDGQTDFINKKKENENLKFFIDNTFLVDSTTLADILSFSKVYLKQLENE